MPPTEEQWKSIAENFQETWNFPNCIGSQDGKHINLKCPKNYGSYYFNYKGTFSIVLMGLVDANYKFLYIDVRCKVRICDGGVFLNCHLSKALEQNAPNIPSVGELPNDGRKLPYVIVGDDVFPLKTYLMKPYPHQHLSGEKRIFNYRLSRARRVVENTFGILANRLRAFLTTINLSPGNIEKIVVESCAVHNYLRTNAGARYIAAGFLDRVENDGTFVDGQWRNEQSLNSIPQQGSNFYSREAKHIRDEYCDYFNSNGKVSWQDSCI